MSVAAVSRESMRPVLPFLREAAVHRAEAVGRPSHHPASTPSHLLLFGDYPADLAEP
jgi:hypothetical protein